MKRIRGLRPSRGGAIGIALVVALGGVAFAAIPDPDGTVHACYQQNSGDLRVVDSGESCRKSERPLTLAGSGGGGAGTGSESLKLDAGQSGVLLQLGPFTFTAYCETLGQESRVTVESSENGSLIGFGSGPVPAGQERNVLTDTTGSAAAARWSAVTPSGVFGSGDVQLRRNAFGADCLFAADGIA